MIVKNANGEMIEIESQTEYDNFVDQRISSKIGKNNSNTEIKPMKWLNQEIEKIEKSEISKGMEQMERIEH